MTKFNRIKIFFKSCLLFFSKRAEAKIGETMPTKDEFSVIDNVLYYISGKTRIKIKEHFPQTAHRLRETHGSANCRSFRRVQLCRAI